jgi:hypothetical protein
LFAEVIKKNISIEKMVKCQTSLKNLLLFQLSIQVEGMQQEGFQNEMNAENGKFLSVFDISLTKKKKLV